MTEQVPFSTEFADNPEPRVPSLLVLDVSGSMRGQPIIELNKGLVAYKDELAADSLANKRVETAIITFGDAVQTECDWCTSDNFIPPNLAANGQTPMGQAIESAIDMLKNRKTVYKTNGIQYMRPWIWLVTDGGPTDAWQNAAERVKVGERNKEFAFFCVGVQGANMEILKQIALRQPVELDGLRFRDMFQWLSASLKSASRSKPNEELALTNPVTPNGWAKI